MSLILIEAIMIDRIRVRRDLEYHVLYYYYIIMVIMDLFLVFFSIGYNYALFRPVSAHKVWILHISEIGLQISYYSLLGMFVLYIAKFIGIRKKEEIRIAPVIVPVCVLWALLWSISSFNGMIFRTTEEGFVRGPFYWFGQAGGYFCLLMICFLIIRNRKMLTRKDTLALFSPVVFPALISFLRSFWPGLNYMPVAMSLALIFFYGFIHMEDAWKAKEQEVQLTNARISLMRSQIRPHFLYNTLNSIYVLCGRDPELAQRAIHDFTRYLRNNLSNLEEEREIPLFRELEHVHYYLELEKLRFPDRLNVVYDIQANDCKIPPLTLQPLVENAVKHGLMKRREGGTVTISSRRTGDWFEIRIQDDGVGISEKDLKMLQAPEPEKTKASEEYLQEHVGIRNVRERLRGISQASLDIQSTPGEGTLVTIWVPADKKQRGKTD